MNAIRHFLLALQFFTRIPVTGRLGVWVDYSPQRLQASAAYFPVVGWLVGAWAAAVLVLALRLWGQDPAGVAVAVLLSMAATVWLTGAFHEDGLADTADALGGAVSRDRALEIMKDSRIGSYAAVTLALALALKAALLTQMALVAPARALLALAVAHSLSRLAPLLVMRALPYAGDAQASKSKPLAQAVSGAALALALAWCIPAGVAVFIHAGAIVLMALTLCTLAVPALMAHWLARRLQGFTGDTLGATQQLTELALYLALAAAWGRAA